MNIIKVDSVSSTNTWLKELSGIQETEEATVVVAREQTSGRGQTGTSWEAETGKNLTFSVLFKPCFLPVSNNFLISQAISLGIKKALDNYTNDIRIKWPNDIYYQDKKLVGILIENEITDQRITRSIIGIGVNVNQDIFKSNAPNPVSLKQILHADLDLDQLLENIIVRILQEYNNLKNGLTEKISREYFSSLYRNSGYHLFSDNEGIFRASITNVKENGLLGLVTINGEFRQYAFKEVTYIT